MTEQPTVHRYLWDRGKPTAEHGALIKCRERMLFIPAEDILTVATGLADVLEQYRGQQ